MKEALANYVKRVRDLAEHVRGNEQATKQSLIGPLFTLLGYDLTDPRECIPEYRADFGKERSAKPVDWSFIQNGKPIFFVEAKDAGKKLAGYDEQLADYFAKAPEAKLGILTNGIHWKFFTDLVNANVMDKEPFVTWDVLADENPPHDFLTLLQKSQYNAQLIRTFAERRRNQNLLVAELARLLEPSPEFTKLAVANIETRNLTAAVVEGWKPVLANAINEWAKQRALSTVLNGPNRTDAVHLPPEVEESGPKVETTKEELDAFTAIKAMLGIERPVTYTDTSSYFKVHLPERHTWVVCRLYLGKRRSSLALPLDAERLKAVAADLPFTPAEKGWSSISIETSGDLEKLGPALKLAWDHVRTARFNGPDGSISMDER